MFYHIEGIVCEIEPYVAVLDCSGVGYKINTTLNTISQLKLGEKSKLFIYDYIKEDCFDLYGFISKSEKRSFELLISVSGVGPKAAISILSSTTPEGLAMSIVSGDEKALMVAQGIGKKIAQRVILELKDKIAKGMDEFPSVSSGSSNVALSSDSSLNDALAALIVLGYSASECNMALRAQDITGMKTEEIIKLVLKNMMK